METKLNENKATVNKVKRGLKGRQLNMIAIGGTIGTGLFLASGYNIQKAGAGGGPIAYLIIGILVYFLMMGLGEMATFMPTSGHTQLLQDYLFIQYLDLLLGGMSG